MKPVFSLYLAFLISLSLLSCGQREEKDFRIMTDDIGREVKVPLRIERVMGLAPSMTEMLYVICGKEKICGRSDQCNFPDVILDKPAISVYPPDPESLLMLAPDIVFAVEGITMPDDARRIEDAGIPVFFLKFRTTGDVFNRLEKMGQILEEEIKARRYADSLRTIREELRKAAFLSNKEPSVLYLIWHEPLFAHGYFSPMTEKLHLAGARNALDSTLKTESPELTREYILNIDPDVLLGGDFEFMDQNLFAVYPELKRLKCYQSRRIYKPTEDLQSRPGPRVMEAVFELKKLIHEK